MLAAAASLALFAGLALVLSTGRNPQVPAAETVPVWTPPRSLPGDAPEPGAFAAHVANPPAWLGELGPGLRTGALRTGRWVTAAIGAEPQQTDSPRRSPCRRLMDPGKHSRVHPPSRSTAAPSCACCRSVTGRHSPHPRDPQIAAAGNVDQHTLHDVLSATRITSHEDRFTIMIGTMPDGYVELVPPHALPADTTPRRTLAETGGALAINEVSEWADPLLYAASTGADITGYALATTTGWSGTSTSGPYGTITFVVWSPRPGVLLSRSTRPTPAAASMTSSSSPTIRVSSPRPNGTTPTPGDRARLGIVDGCGSLRGSPAGAHSGRAPAKGYRNDSETAVGVTGALLTELSEEGDLDLTDGRIHLTERSRATRCAPSPRERGAGRGQEVEEPPVEDQAFRVE